MDHGMDAEAARIREREYLAFLDDDADHGIYTNLVKDMVKNKGIRLIINLNDLRRKNPARCASLLLNSFEEMHSFEVALREFVTSLNPDYARQKEHFFIGFEGSFGSRHVTPRTLSARLLGNLVCLEGIVTKCSLVRPKVVKSVHFCPTTRKFTERIYSDSTSYEGLTTSAVYPTRDEEGNLLQTEYGLSIYKDHQTFTVQEMPEKAPPGQLPRSVDVIADNDLVDVVKPGDRVQVSGAFRCLPSKQGAFTTGVFRSVLLSNHLCPLSKEAAPTISPEDIKKCRQFSRNKDVFDLMARSLAPSIHGHEYVKKAILCMLLGGLEKTLPNGTRLRGDINVMLIGDPSTAKSQLLRYVLVSAPRAIATTGRGSSGVGLTAAVTSDAETGERRLEAGAMVLADRGVVCIDEFDKMSDIDRTAIHEVMEQGRVTITKAGIHARLNARCSVLAAANPVYGRYDEYKSPMENIGMQDSLLSRFDLLFIILDKHEQEADKKIADHVVRMHRYRDPHEQDGEPLPVTVGADLLTTRASNEEQEEISETPIYEKYNNLLHGNRRQSEKIVSVKFLKKYIHIARSMQPELTDEASSTIAEAYANLRSFEREQEEFARTQPITVRALETMIRLATAHAKGRMSRKVEVKDANAAIELVQFAYFKKIIEKPKKHAHSDEESGDELEDEEGDVEMSAAAAASTTTSSSSSRTQETRSTSRRREESQDVGLERDFDGNEDALGHSHGQEGDEEESEQQKVSPAKLREFKRLLCDAFRNSPSQKLTMDQVADATSEFNWNERKTCLSLMEEENLVMVSDGQVFLI